MPPPWLAIIDAAVGFAHMALARHRTSSGEGEETLSAAGGMPSPAPRTLETDLAGVVVAALREVFDRDSRRLELERELAEADRERAERALRLELRRQAGDREIGRLRLLGGLAVVIWLPTLLLSPRALAAGLHARIALGSAWFFLIAALASVFVALSHVSRALADPEQDRAPVPQPGAAGTLAAVFILAGLALAGTAALIR